MRATGNKLVEVRMLHELLQIIMGWTEVALDGLGTALTEVATTYKF